MTLTAPSSDVPTVPRAARLGSLVASGALLLLPSAAALSMAASHGAISAAVHALLAAH